MHWIIEQPVLYVIEKPAASSHYETWLGVATLAGKYSLFSYLGVPKESIAPDGEDSVALQIGNMAKKLYARDGAFLAALPTNKGSFRECPLVANSKLCLEIDLTKMGPPGQVTIAALDEAIGRPVNKLSSLELDDLLARTNRSDHTRVSWDPRPLANFLPPVRAVDLGRLAVWG